MKKYLTLQRKDLKTCTKCKEKQDLNCFFKRKTSKNGLNNICKKCISEYQKKYHQKNKEKFNKKSRDYHTNNKERLNKQDKKRYQKNKEKVLKTRKKYYEKNKEEIRYIQKVYYKNNKEKINKIRGIYSKNRKKTDLNYKLACNLRTRIYQSLKGISKSASTMKLIGCDIEKLREHLKIQFWQGMTWENYGEWHVDHIIPCASFDLTKPEQQRECFNYKNLQPLWEFENLSKGDKIVKGIT